MHMTNENSDSLTLRVAKAIPSDVGHGRARVPFDNDLNLKPGDIIEVSGERKTAAIVWRCRPEAVSYTHLTLPTILLV